MMAVVASFTNNQLCIVGDAAADTVAINTVDVGGVAQVTVNGQGVGSGVNASAVTSIFATLGGGNDTMDLSTLDLTKFSGLTDGSIEIRGGAGNDTLVGSPLGDILKGEDGNDSLNGGAGNDQLIGGNGNDTLIGGAGDDTLDGGLNDDIYSFSGTTNLGSDTVIQSASGNLDTLGFGSFGGAIVVDISMTTPQVVRAGLLTLTLSDGAGIDNVQGTAYDDVILGNAGGNSLMGNGGNDYLWGRGGNDWLDGGAGNDTLYGGDGNDTLLGKGGNDSLYGHAGDDTLNGNEGNDYLSGDEGDDTYIVTNYGTKTIGAASGSDRIDVSGQTLTGTLDLSSTSVQTIAASLSVRFTAANAVAWVLGGAKNHQASVGEFIDGYYTVPGIPGTTTMLEFEYGGAIAAYSNKVYVYDASDDPEHPDGTYLFTGHAQGQSPKPMTFPAGTRLGFYIEQDGDPGVRFYSDDYKNNNDLSAPRNHVDADALAPGKIQLSWEDLYYVLPNPNDYIFDGDYNDLFMSVEVTKLAPSVEVAVSPASVEEDGPQGLIFSFTRSGPTDDSLAVFFSVGGTASAVFDYTGISSGVGTQTVTIRANESSADVVIFPVADNEIEFDETISFTLLPDSTYGLGSRSVAEGAIENDDYFLDLVIDGLPEETFPEPNEISPGALLVFGGERTRLELNVESPGYAGTISLAVVTGSDAVTLWDAQEGGNQVQPSTWYLSEYPSVLWIETTEVEADVEFVAMFQNKGTQKQDTGKAKSRTAEWQAAGTDADGRPDATFSVDTQVQPKTYDVNVDPISGDPPEGSNPPPNGPDPDVTIGDGDALEKWMRAYAAQSGLGLIKGADGQNRQSTGEFAPGNNGAPEFAPEAKKSTDPAANLQGLGNVIREGQVRNNVWRVEFGVTVIPPEKWTAETTLPKWLQYAANDARLSPQARHAWEEFVGALDTHEQIHRAFWDDFVHDYEERVEAFAKTTFYGEAADANDRVAQITAFQAALTQYKAAVTQLTKDLKSLATAYNEKTVDYDQVSDHGANQAEWDASMKNVDIDNTISLHN